MTSTITLLWLGFLSSTPVEPTAQTEAAVEPASVSDPFAAPEPWDVAPGPASRAREPDPQPAPRRGLGLLVSGGLVLGTVVLPTLGLTIMDSIAAAECKHSENECWGGILLIVTVPVMVSGLAVGAPLLAAGVQRNRAWREWQSKHDVALRPRLNPGRHGLTVGFELRF